MVRVDDNTVILFGNMDETLRIHRVGARKIRRAARMYGGAHRNGAATISAEGDSHVHHTKEGKEIFVVDGHIHFWDGSPENQRNIHGKQFIECFYAYSQRR